MSPTTNGLAARPQKSVPFFDLSGTHERLRADLGRIFGDVVANNAFIGGEWVDRFEQEWADYCGATHAVGVGNGTDALELVLAALGIGPGDEVIVPANTFAASASAIVSVGGTPVFVDVDPGTLLLGPDQVRAAITPRTSAVIAVHLFGQPVDIPALRSVTAPAGIPIIEDAAQAHGATFGEERAGSMGLVATFSFYPGKNLGALGDGGAVTTSDPALAKQVRMLANHGRSDHHAHEVSGRNSRLDGLQAAVLSRKLADLESMNEARDRLVARYNQRLSLVGVEFTQVAEAAVSAHHLLVAQFDQRDELRAYLDENQIGTGVHYPVPCHRQPAFEAYAPGYLPVVERAANRIVSLPLFPHLQASDVDAVCDVIAAWVQETSR